MDRLRLSMNENDINYFEKQWNWHKNNKKQKSNLKLYSSYYGRLHDVCAKVQVCQNILKSSLLGGYQEL